jgi:hypothetical protein
MDLSSLGCETKICTTPVVLVHVAAIGSRRTGNLVTGARVRAATIFPRTFGWPGLAAGVLKRSPEPCLQVAASS